MKIIIVKCLTKINDNFWYDFLMEELQIWFWRNYASAINSIQFNINFNTKFELINENLK